MSLGRSDAFMRSQRIRSGRDSATYPFSLRDSISLLLSISLCLSSSLSFSLILLACCRRRLLGRLVPGKILLGKYPGQIPSDLPTDRQTARDRVREIVLRGGVTELLSLQVGAVSICQCLSVSTSGCQCLSVSTSV